MKVKELIELLKSHDPEIEVMIQQGEDHDFMTARSVSQMELWDADSPDEEDTVDVVVIQYT